MELSKLEDRKGILLLYSSAGLSSMIFGARNLTLPIYFGYLGFSPSLIGILFTVSQVFGAIVAIPIGVLADRWGRKGFILVGRLLQVAGVLPLIFFTDLYAILISAILFELGVSSSGSPYGAMLADKSPLEKRVMIFTHNYIGTSVGSAIGAAISVVPPYLKERMGFTQIAGYVPLFMLWFLIALSSLIVVLFLHEGERAQKVEPRSPSREKSVRRTSIGRIFKFSLTFAMIQLGAGMIVQLFSLWLHIAFGVVETQLAPLYVVINLSMGLGYFLANRLANSIGSVPSIVVTQFIATILLIILPNISSFEIVGAVYVIRTMIMNMATPVMTSYITGIVPVNERASALSVSTSAGSLSRSVGPAIGGYLMEEISLSMPFYICGVLYASSTALFYAFFKRIKPEE